MSGLEGISKVSREATQKAIEIIGLVHRDRSRWLKTSSSTLMAAKLFELLPENPIITITKAMKLLSTTRPTATKAIQTLQEAKILFDKTGKKRDRVYQYTAYLETLIGD